MRLNLGSSKATFKVIEIKNVNERNGKFSWDFFKKRFTNNRNKCKNFMAQNDIEIPNCIQIK